MLFLLTMYSQGQQPAANLDQSYTQCNNRYGIVDVMVFHMSRFPVWCCMRYACQLIPLTMHTHTRSKTHQPPPGT